MRIVLFFDIHSVWVLAGILLVISGVAFFLDRKLEGVVRANVRREDAYSYFLEEAILTVSGSTMPAHLETADMKRFGDLALERNGPLCAREVVLFKRMLSCSNVIAIPMLLRLFRSLVERLRRDPVNGVPLLDKVRRRHVLFPYEKQLNAIIDGLPLEERSR